MTLRTPFAGVGPLEEPLGLWLRGRCGHGVHHLPRRLAALAALYFCLIAYPGVVVPLDCGPAPMDRCAMAGNASEMNPYRTPLADDASALLAAATRLEDASCAPVSVELVTSELALPAASARASRGDSVEEAWALVRAAASGAHHTGQRAYTRTSAMTPPRSSRLRCADCVAPGLLRRAARLHRGWRRPATEGPARALGSRRPAGARSPQAPAGASGGTHRPTTASSRDRMARRWTGRRCTGATARSRRPQASVHCASTTCGTRSVPRRSRLALAPLHDDALRPPSAAPRGRGRARTALHGRRRRVRPAARRARRPPHH